MNTTLKTTLIVTGILVVSAILVLTGLWIGRTGWGMAEYGPSNMMTANTTYGNGMMNGGRMPALSGDSSLSHVEGMNQGMMAGNGMMTNGSGMIQNGMMRGGTMMNQGMMYGNGMMGVSQTDMMTRHMATIPDDYAGLTNPIPADDASLARGQELYTNLCATCHGNTGLGDGPGGAALNPTPAALAHTSQMLSDAYLFWRISEGGVPFGTAMPAWREALDEQARWDLINFVQALGSNH